MCNGSEATTMAALRALKTPYSTRPASTPLHDKSGTGTSTLPTTCELPWTNLARCPHGINVRRWSISQTSKHLSEGLARAPTIRTLTTTTTAFITSAETPLPPATTPVISPITSRTLVPSARKSEPRRSYHHHHHHGRMAQPAKCLLSSTGSHPSPGHTHGWLSPQ
jgi:hypothetical protein